MTLLNIIKFKRARKACKLLTINRNIDIELELCACVFLHTGNGTDDFSVLVVSRHAFPVFFIKFCIGHRGIKRIDRANFFAISGLFETALFTSDAEVIVLGLAFFFLFQLESDHQIVQILLSDFVDIIAMQLQLNASFNTSAFDIETIDLNLAVIDDEIMLALREIIPIKGDLDFASLWPA